MVVCKFFLENRCKFGENCRNEHPRGGSSQRSLFSGQGQTWQDSGSPRVSFRDSFGTSGQGSSNQYKWTANQPSGQGQDNSNYQQTSTLELVNSLPKEIECWEKSHMWPYSCIAVDKDLPSLPGLYDICTEELRLEAYQAMKSGDVQPYTQRIQSLQSEFESKRKQLQHMTLDLKSKLIAIIDEARKKTQTQSGLASSSVFGSAQPTQNLFGQNQTSASSGMFGAVPSAPGSSNSGLFGKSTPGSTFGGQFSSGVENAGSFGSPGASLFGKPVGTGSVFGNQPQGQTAQPSNPFGLVNQSNPSNSAGLFGQSAVQGQQASNLFGKSATNQPTSLFGNVANTTNQPASLFGNVANTTNQPASLFGNVANTTTNQSASLFGVPAASPSQGLFGKPSSGNGQVSNTPFSPANSSQTMPTSVFGGSVNQDKSSATLFGKSIPGSTSTAQNIFGSLNPGQGQGSGDMTGQQSQGSLFTTISAAPTSDQGHYTPLADLTEHEKAAFSAKTFELGKIPIRPPPRQMIN